MESLKDLIKDLVERALIGELTFEELYDKWPQELEFDPFYEEVLLDLEAGIENFPPKVSGEKTDYETWVMMEEHAALSADLALLDFELDTDEQLMLKDKLLIADDLTVENLKNLIEEYLHERSPR